MYCYFFFSLLREGNTSGDKRHEWSWLRNPSETQHTPSLSPPPVPRSRCGVSHPSRQLSRSSPPPLPPPAPPTHHLGSAAVPTTFSSLPPPPPVSFPLSRDSHPTPSDTHTHTLSLSHSTRHHHHHPPPSPSQPLLLSPFIPRCSLRRETKEPRGYESSAGGGTCGGDGGGGSV